MSTTSESTQNIYGELPSTWQLTTLGELIKIKKMELQTGPFGTMLHASSYKDVGTPVLAVQHIGNNRIIHGLDIPRVDEETHQRLARYEIKVNDIIFCRKGAVERTALVTDKENGWLQGSDCIRLRLIDPLINPIYISYIFCSNQYKKWIVQHAHGATMPSLNQQIISLSPLALPQIEEQKQIADVLSCLDAKIENLRRQNEALEQIAQTLFKHWFIDFEFPNADGKPYKSSGGTMSPSKLGELPKDWHIGTLNDCLSLIIDYRGKTPKKLGSDWSTEGIPALSAKNIKNGKILAENLVNFGDEALYKKWMKDELIKGDILLTSEAPLGEVYCLASNQKYILSQRLFALRINNEFSYSYLYFWLRSPQGQHLLLRRATGSTVQGIRQSELREVEIIIPENKILKNASNLWMSLLEKIELNYQQIQTLTKTRDSLLPKLMSGQLRVKE